MLTALLPAADAATLAQFVGVPYVARGRTLAGADCWGLVRLAARVLWGVELPEYFYAQDDLLLSDARGLIARETSSWTWRQAVDPFPRCAVHIFRIRGAETHCGLHLGGVEFLHSLPGRNSCIESLNDSNWRQRRTGTYVYD